MKRCLAACVLLAGAQLAPCQKIPNEFEADRIPQIVTHGSVLIRHGRVETIANGLQDGADILILNGKIAKIGKNLQQPPGVTLIDATGMFVTPGLVDAHSHRAEDETNEWADSITAEVRIHDVLEPQAPGLYYALASGITTDLILHGSSNPIGGQSIVIKNKWRRRVDEVVFKGAPRMIKFALGENPREVNGRDSTDPIRYAQTRLGVESIYRRAFADAKSYIKQWAEYRTHPVPGAAPPRRDLRLEALADILQGKIWVQCHSYRQDEMLMMVRLSQEFGFHLVLQHALESYKIAREIAAAHVPVSMFGDAFVYKLEVIDSIPMATAICDAAGVLTSVNTDTFSGVVPLTQDAGKSLRYGVSEDHALKMLTLNPAIELGVQDRVGTLEVGKDGDIAIWSGHPLSVYSKCILTMIEGNVEFQRRENWPFGAKAAAASSVVERKFNPDAPTLKSSTSYLIVGATIHPVSGPDLPVGNVLIVHDKIVSVSSGKTAAPAGTVIVQGKGLHVYPGLIDSGSVLGLEEIGEVPQSQDVPENGDYLTDLKAAAAINPESMHFPKVRFNGITNTLVRPLGTLFDGQSSFLNTCGYTNEEMTLEKEAALTVEVPSGLSPESVVSLSPDDLQKARDAISSRRRAIKEYFERGRRYLAERAADPLTPDDVKLDALEPYLQGRKPVVFYANGPSEIKFVIALSKDLGLKPVIGGAREAWKVADLLAKNHIGVILDPPAVSCPGSDEPSTTFDPYDSPFAGASVLRAAGVSVAFASESFDEAMNLPYRVGRLCAYGLSHDDAIRGLTLDAAKLLGQGGSLGSLEAGKLANLIVTDGDPLELTTSVRYEFISGQPVPLKTHFTELYKKYMARVKKP